MLGDLRAAGHHPAVVLVSEHEKIDLKADLLAMSKSHGEIDDDADPEDRVQRSIGFIDGCAIASHKDVGRGKCHILMKPQAGPPQRGVDNATINRAAEVK